MHLVGRAVASSVGVLFAFAAASAPAAALKPITGKLGESGYTVIAVAADGDAVARPAGGKFRLAPPAKRVTLQLRGPDGNYAGPIVVGRERKKAIVGVKAGAELGKVKLRDGYAKLAEKLPGDSIDARRTARAKKGVPIGAGVFGRVASSPKGAPGPGEDQDLDGVPGALDIDDDGDLVLDEFDGSTVRRGARTAQTDANFNFFSSLGLLVEATVNANAGSTPAEIDATLPSSGDLLITLRGASAELDCGDPDTGLVYCRKNGSTGKTQTSVPEPGTPESELFSPFPGCCDPDNDGFGTLVAGSPVPGAPLGGMRLRHGATTAEIGTGNYPIQWVNTGGAESRCPPPSDSCASFHATVPYVFATVPALVSYSDGAGNFATVDYPVPGPGEPGGPGPGTGGNPFPVGEGPDADSDVELTVTLWRPQRRPIPGETCPPPPGGGQCWIDIGGLVYTARDDVTGTHCPQSAFSEEDPDLELPSRPINRPGAGGFTDRTPDRPASGDTFTYTLNVTQCLASQGLPDWSPDEVRGLSFSGLSPNAADEASQGVSFKRVQATP